MNAHLLHNDLSDVCVRVETYDQIIEDIKKLLPQHWEEIALYKDEIALAPDYELYKRMHEMGMLVIYAVRKALSDELVGYALYVVRPHLHYSLNRWAQSDIFWIAPQYRRFGIGRALFTFIESDMKEHGVDVMHTNVKVEHPAAALVLETLGHAKIEYGYSKRLV